jgi:hypothetical protein
MRIETAGNRAYNGGIILKEYKRMGKGYKLKDYERMSDEEFNRLNDELNRKKRSGKGIRNCMIFFAVIVVALAPRLKVSSPALPTTVVFESFITTVAFAENVIA